MRKRQRQSVKWMLLVLIVGVLGLCIWMIHPVRRVEEYLYPRKYQDLVEKYSTEYNLPQTLLYAILHTESSFNPQAVSSVGARGLMQLTESTFEWVRSRLKEEDQTTFDDMFDPETNVRYGGYLLFYLFSRFGEEDVVLSAYHAGMGAVSNWLENPSYSSDGTTLDTIPYDDTRWYVHKISNTQEKYKKLYFE